MSKLEFRVATEQECIAVQQMMDQLSSKNRIYALNRSRLGPALRASGLALTEQSPLILYSHVLTSTLKQQGYSSAFFIDLHQCAEQVFEQHQRLVERTHWQREAKACIAQLHHQQETQVPRGFKGKLSERCKALNRAIKAGRAGELKSQVYLAREVLSETQQAATLSPQGPH